MFKKTALYITGTLLLVALILVSLFLSADLANRQQNGFDRVWPMEIVTPLREVTIQAPLSRFAGGTHQSYFFSVPNPQGTILFDSTLSRQDTMVYGLPIHEGIFEANSLWIDSPDVYFFANNIPALYRGRLNAYEMDSIALGDMPFTRAVWISSSSIVLRSLTNSLQDQVFRKIDSRTGKVLVESKVITLQQAGGFESDGTLLFDAASHQLFYIQYYCNEFYCLDTNLSVLYKGRTIDTTSFNPAAVRRVQYKDGDKISPGTSRVTVNQTACASNGYLFVVSGLKADNESNTSFRSNAVIDYYRITDGSYKGSFYIPLPEAEKISSLWVTGQKLMVLFKSTIRQYQLSL